MTEIEHITVEEAVLRALDEDGKKLMTEKALSRP